MARMETGVDKLVQLVEKEKKIELSSAAKQLNVDVAVVKEWAEFLEEERIIGIQYSLSKTFLVEKRMSKQEVESKEKEYGNKKEAFVRRVDAALKQLEDQTAGFESIKAQYNRVKENIGDEIDAVKEELEQLRHYEQLKNSIDQDILKQKLEYQKSLDEIHSRLSGEEKRYQKIIREIEAETEKLKGEREGFADLKKEEEDLRKRIDALQDIIKSITTRLDTQKDAVKTHEERLQTLRELGERLHQDLLDKRKKEIEPMLQISSDQSKRILRIQDEIVEKIKSSRDKMVGLDEQAQEIAQRFERFFEKRTKTERLLKELDQHKEEIRDGLSALIRKAKSYDIAQKEDVNKYVQDLEKEFKQFDQKKSSFSGKLEELRAFILGKDGRNAPRPPAKRKTPSPVAAKKGKSARKAAKALGKRAIHPRRMRRPSRS